MLTYAEASAMDYLYEQEKRLALAWNTNDKVGITTGVPNYGMMEQLAFWVSSKTSSAPNERSLYATGYALRENTHYYSYSPYMWQDDFDAQHIPCPYTGQKQAANADAKHLSAFDYQMADATPAAGACTFRYKHTGGVLRVSFLAPSAMTLHAVSIKAQTEVLANATEMNIVNQSVTPSGYSKTITLATDNFNVLPGEKVVCYLAVAAQDLSAEKLTVTITDYDGYEQPLATVMGPDIKAGKMYDVAITQTTNASKPLHSADKQRQRPIATAVGVSYPVVVTSAIPIDDTYTVQYVEQPDVPTAISVPSHTDNSGAYYTISGVRVTKNQKGSIVIFKGKKIIRR